MEDRIAKLEKTCARYRMFFVLIVLVFVAGISIAATDILPDKIVAKRLIAMDEIITKSLYIVNNKNKVIIKVTGGEFGGGQIIMLGENGKRIFLVTADKTRGGILSLSNKDGSLYFSVGGNKDRNGGLLSFYNKQGKSLSGIAAIKGNGLLILDGKNEKRRFIFAKDFQ